MLLYGYKKIHSREQFFLSVSNCLDKVVIQINSFQKILISTRSGLHGKHDIIAYRLVYMENQSPWNETSSKEKTVQQIVLIIISTKSEQFVYIWTVVICKYRKQNMAHNSPQLHLSMKNLETFTATLQSKFQNVQFPSDQYWFTLFH